MKCKKADDIPLISSKTLGNVYVITNETDLEF